MFDRDTFTVEEWGSIISVPASVGALVVTADPSGPMGLIKEFRAIMETMKDYVETHAAASPLLGAIQTYMSTKPTEEEEAQLKQWAELQQEEIKANKPQTHEELKQVIRDRTGEAFSLLRAKGATEEDINLFKGMMIAVAESVANASKEGGFLGFGGVRVSEAEESILAQIRGELAG